MVKRNCQVVKLVDSEYVNENMVQNSSPTCKHNLFALIQVKKLFVKCLDMWESSKKAQGVRIALCQSKIEKWGSFIWKLNTVPAPINGAPSIQVKNILRDSASSNRKRLQKKKNFARKH